MNAYKKTMTMSCKRGIYKPLECIEINGERWVITKIEMCAQPFADTLYLEPLYNFIAKHHITDVGCIRMTIDELIRSLIENYEGGRSE